MYLTDRPFTVYTDHHSLKTILQWKNPKPRVQRWLEILQMYSFTAYYRSGCSNLNADAMSRLFATHIPQAYAEGSIKITADPSLVPKDELITAEMRDMIEDPEFMCLNVPPLSKVPRQAPAGISKILVVLRREWVPTGDGS